MDSRPTLQDGLGQLALNQALYQALAAAVRTGDPGNLRGRVDALVLDAYSTLGAKGFDMSLAGEKVGTVSVRFSKAAHDTEIVVEDEIAFDEWLVENDLAHEDVTYRLADRAYADAVARMAAEGILEESRTLVREDGFMTECRKQMAVTGEVPDGCDVREVDRPAAPVGTTVRVDVARVAELVGGQLPEPLRGLLAGE